LTATGEQATAKGHSVTAVAPQAREDAHRCTRGCHRSELAGPYTARHDPADGWFTRHLLAPLIKKIFRANYADLAITEDELRDSALDWTVIRPPRLLTRPVSGIYRTALGANVARGMSIARADVTHLMLRVTPEAETFQKAMGVAY